MTDIAVEEKPRKTFRDFSWKVGAKMVAVIAVCCAPVAYAADRFQFGIDDQVYRCLPERFYIIDTYSRPKAEDIKRGAYIAIRMTADQSPKGATWGAGARMIKRVVATHPGDTMHVRKDGVSFTSADGTETWKHGTALEVAKDFGWDEDMFVRDSTLKPGEMFMMGDNFKSYDSRYYGPVNEDQIYGTVVWAW
ncbi:signal peptidase I [Sinirhodobacter populi]|uniref:Signal peptidase I n=1 Tax=Paenirhodobacter populi TaxID=2306993 RepID=A0A443KD70_9RHOB|nr:signal peptidase I [Sinirhodobacter populi]RWR30543.1 signal peptidase I [Sinirhodobacter populi]